MRRALFSEFLKEGEFPEKPCCCRSHRQRREVVLYRVADKLLLFVSVAEQGLVAWGFFPSALYKVRQTNNTQRRQVLLVSGEWLESPHILWTLKGSWGLKLAN